MNLEIIRSLNNLKIRTIFNTGDLSMAIAVMRDEISGRIKRFQEKLSTHGVDGALIVEKTDLYYLSGTKQEGHLFVPDGGAPLLMVRRDFEKGCFRVASPGNCAPERLFRTASFDIRGKGCVTPADGTGNGYPARKPLFFIPEAFPGDRVGGYFPLDPGNANGQI